MKLKRSGLIFVISTITTFALVASLAPVIQVMRGWLAGDPTSLPANVASAAPAGASLSITPISWGVVGLDSNDVTDGPDTYMIGARVCNTGDTPTTTWW